MICFTMCVASAGWHGVFCNRGSCWFGFNEFQYSNDPFAITNGCQGSGEYERSCVTPNHTCLAWMRGATICRGHGGDFERHRVCGRQAGGGKSRKVRCSSEEMRRMRPCRGHAV